MQSPSAVLLRQLREGVVCVPPPNLAGFEPLWLANLDAAGTWPDIDYADRGRAEWAPRMHLVRARALAAEASARGDALLAETTRRAVRGWFGRDPTSSNWWHNQIGAVRLLGDVLLLIGEPPGSALLAEARPFLLRAGEFLLAEDGRTRLPQSWTGANRLWISLNRLITAALFADEEEAASAVSAAMEEVRVAGPGEEGIQVDGSFHQHGPLLYNGGYGLGYLRDCILFFAATRGTPWAPEAARRDLLADYILDGTRWMLRGEDINHGCRDREISRPRRLNAELIPVVEFLAADGGARAPELRELAEALREGRAPGALEGNRMFYRADFMAHHRRSSHLSVRMHSRRTIRGESGNGEGRRSHHIADGLTYLMRRGDEYLDVFPVWDWQRLPGTTCVRTPRPEPWQLVWGPGLTPGTGGVSDGRHGACTQLLYNNLLHARKSWFFGPDAMICLGSEILSGHDGVATTLDQCLRQGAVTWSGGAGVPLEDGTHALTDVAWLRHGPWGFIFPAKASILVELGKRAGRWSEIGSGPRGLVARDVFQVSIPHPEPGPDIGEGYAYAVLDDVKSDQELAAQSERASFAIVARNSAAHAVWWPDAGLFQAAFFQSGEIAWAGAHQITVSRECCVQLLRGTDGAWALSVADTAQAGGEVSVDLGGLGFPATTYRMVLPTGSRAGSTVTARIPDWSN